MTDVAAVFSERLRTLRRTRKWTLDKAEEITGIPRSTISSYEQGKRMPGIDVLYALSTSTFVSARYFLGQIDTMIEKNDYTYQATGLDDIDIKRWGEISSFLDELRILLHSETIEDLLQAICYISCPEVLQGCSLDTIEFVEYSAIRSLQRLFDRIKESARSMPTGIIRGGATIAEELKRQRKDMDEQLRETAPEFFTAEEDLPF